MFEKLLIRTLWERFKKYGPKPLLPLGPLISLISLTNFAVFYTFHGFSVLSGSWKHLTSWGAVLFAFSVFSGSLNINLQIFQEIQAKIPSRKHRHFSTPFRLFASKNCKNCVLFFCGFWIMLTQQKVKNSQNSQSNHTRDKNESSAQAQKQSKFIFQNDGKFRWNQCAKTPTILRRFATSVELVRKVFLGN